jgi:DNA helicase II / ATP-dependent DNA helicase PcrA
LSSAVPAAANVHRKPAMHSINSDVEEERRLYVAMTRAKDHLHTVVPQRFFIHQQRSSGDRHVYAVRTRFIPDNVTEHFEQCAWPPPARDGSLRRQPTLKTVDIGAQLKSMWR